MSYSPLDIFKRTISFLYREIGVLRDSNHADVYQKAKTENDFFGENRKRLAHNLYHKTKNFDDPVLIIAPYEENDRSLS